MITAIKKNPTLFIGLAIPVALLVVVAVLVYAPLAFIKPTGSFAYASGESYIYDFTVENGVVALHSAETDDSYYKPPKPRLFIHNVQTNTNQEVTLEQLQQMRLHSGQESPQGFKVESTSGGSSFWPFGSRSYGNYFLRKGVYSKKLNLKRTTEYSSFEFLGWVQ